MEQMNLVYSAVDSAIMGSCPMLPEDFITRSQRAYGEVSNSENRLGLK